MSQKVKDYLLLHFIVFIWGFAAIFGVLISLPAVEVVLYRTGLSAIGLFFIVWFSGKKFGIRSGTDRSTIFLVGVLIAIHWILFFLSAKISNVSVCLAGMATASLWTSLFEPVYFRYRIKNFEVLLSVIALGGMVIIFNVEFDHFVGLLFAILSAMSAAAFTVLNSSLIKRNDHFVITFYEMGIAAASIGLGYPFFLWLSGVEGFQMSIGFYDWLFVFLLAGLCTVFAYSYSIKLMRRLSAFNINLTINLEPVYGIMLAVIIFGEKEKMSFGFYLGTLLILISVLAYPILNRIVRKKPLETDILR